GRPCGDRAGGQRQEESEGPYHARQPTDPILREHRPHRCPTSADDPRLRDERQVITHPAWCAAAPTRRASARLQNGKISDADRAGGFIRGYRRWQRRILRGPRLAVVRRHLTVPRIAQWPCGKLSAAICLVS